MILTPRMHGMKRIAVVGLGNMGKHHVRHWAEIPDAHLVAVCDVSLDRANAFASQYSCTAYTDLEILLDSEELDGVSLTVPTFLHHEYGKRLLARGISVLIEKPIAQTLDEADDLIRLASLHNCTLMVGHIERFNPAVSALKAYVDEENLGAIVSLISRRANMFPSQMKDANVAIDLAVHDLDIVTYFLNQAPIQIQSHFGKALITSRPDHLDIFLTYPTASAFVQVNWITPNPIRQLCVTGTKGYAQLDYSAKTVSICTSILERLDADTVKFLPSTPFELPVPKTDALREELLHFLSCLTKKTYPITSGETGRLALELALKALS